MSFDTAVGIQAHGSGGRQPHLTNLCRLPACTQLLQSPAAKIIPHMFRIMDESAVTGGRQTVCSWLVEDLGAACQPEKRKVGSSTLPLTTSFGLAFSALTSANADCALSCLLLSSDHDCPCVTVVGRPLSHADRTSRLRGPGPRLLRPELAVPPGLWPSSQLAQCGNGRAGWRLSRDVAVPDWCTAPTPSAPVPGAVLTPDLPFFRPGVAPSRHATCERTALPLLADASRRLPGLLSPLLSVAAHLQDCEVMPG
jgi:hypothetical protein